MITFCPGSPSPGGPGFPCTPATPGGPCNNTQPVTTANGKFPKAFGNNIFQNITLDTRRTFNIKTDKDSWDTVEGVTVSPFLILTGSPGSPNPTGPTGPGLPLRPVSPCKHPTTPVNRVHCPSVTQSRV